MAGDPHDGGGIRPSISRAVNIVCLNECITNSAGSFKKATTISLTFGQPISGGFTIAPAVVAFGGDAIGVGNSNAPIERRAP
jgi:hypothetical protein